MNQLSNEFINSETPHQREGVYFAYFILAVVILISYGYEIFNFNLTIDEEVHAVRAGRLHLDWVAQGRWGMALLNYLVLQNPITPVVSVSLGLAGTVTGLFVYLKSSYPIDRRILSVLVALAVTVPTLAFTFTFSTLAYGIGFAFLAIGISTLLIRRQAWWAFAVACLLAAFAVSVYQPFVFVLVMVALAGAVNNCNVASTEKFAAAIKLVAYLVGSVAIYLVMNSLILKATSQDVQYVGQFIDLEGFVQRPIERSHAAFERVIQLLSLSSTLFGEHSVWLGLVLLIAMFFSIASPLLRRQYDLLLRAVFIILGTLAVMVFADAITPSGAPIRSLVYLPVGVAIVVVNAYVLAGNAERRVLLSLSALAIIGNSMINNHLQASSAYAEFRDRMLSEAIISKVRELEAKNGGGISLFKVELIGSHAWPGAVAHAKTETFGASFFEWDAGNRWRVAAYLTLNGLPTVGASDEDRIRVSELGMRMPAWPNDGWVTLSGDVVVLKFGQHSIPQRRSLCDRGIAELCD